LAVAVATPEESGEVYRGVPTRSVLLALAPSTGEEQRESDTWSGKV